jgi:uncharacterized protein (TIGR03118 family)
MQVMTRRNSIRTWAAILTSSLCLTAIVSLAVPAKADLLSVVNLISDDPVGHPAMLNDPDLQNAWGVSFSGGSPFWVSDNGTGKSTLYNVNPGSNVPTKAGLVVGIPGAGTPTGQANNPTPASFNGDNFLFVSEDGTISGWRGALGTNAEVLQVANPNNVYKGTTIDVTGGNTYLLSANFHNGTIDVLKGNAGAPDLAGKFTDPNLPAGYAPFNIQIIGGKVYVTYAVQDAAKHDDVAGAGNGIVTAFDLQGNFLGRVVNPGGPLNSPWGLALAPSSLTGFAGDLLVGNFGDGKINAFDPTTNAFIGPLLANPGQPIVIDGLWALTVGNNGGAGSSNKLYFTAGPDSESHGVFGVIGPNIPEPSSLALLFMGSVAALLVGRRRFAAK